MSALWPGTLVGERYEIRAPIHEMPGYDAYTAFDREVEVEVALWLVRGELLPGAASRERFLAGAAAARAFNHVNARRIFAAGAAAGGVYVVVQPAAGEGLRGRLEAGGPARAPELLQYAGAIGDALGAAHEAGMIHGRLIPEDVTKVAGLVKVGGIGLWRPVDAAAAARLWRVRERYLAPEVREVGHEGSPQADVYSLAVIVAELAAGVPALDTGSLLAALSEQQPDLAGSLAIALAVAPARRFESPAHLIERLRRVLVDDRLPPAAGAAAPGRAGEVDDAATVVDPHAGPPASERRRAARETSPYGKGWSEVKLRASRETLPEPDSEPTRAGGGPVGEPPPPVLHMRSMKPISQPGRQRTPLVPALERPEMQPVLRSLASTVAPQSAPPGQLGYYAPPRAAPAPARARAGGWLRFALIGVVGAAVVGVGVWLALTRLTDRGRPAASPPERSPQGRAPEPMVVSPTPAAPDGPCPRDMVVVAGEPRFCLDAHESPGQGRLPQTGVGLGEAEAACAARGARLCAEAEWERGCRGPDGASYPYGDTYRAEPCNTDTGKIGVIAVAGAFADCKSAAGALDMSGNVAEWVAGELTKGGSALDRSDGRCSSKRPRAGNRGYSDVGFRCCRDAAP